MRRVWLAGVVLLLGGVAWADTVVLKGGMKLEGEIVNETDTSLVLKLKAGGRTTLQKKQIEKIVRSEPSEAPPPVEPTPSPRKTTPAPGAKPGQPKLNKAFGTQRFQIALRAARSAIVTRPVQVKQILGRLRQATQLLASDYEAKSIDLETFEMGFALLTMMTIDGLEAATEKPTKAAQLEWFTKSLGPIDESGIFTKEEWKEIQPRVTARTTTLMKARANARMQRNANETRAKGTLKTLETAQKLHEHKHGRYASKLSELGKLIDGELARTGVRNGYRYEMVVSGTELLVIASPVAPKFGGLWLAVHRKDFWEADRPVFKASLPFEAPGGARRY